MKVFMIGGTGLLGSQAAKELIERGHEVTSIALPPLPEGAVLPPEMKIEYGNYLEMSDDEIRAHFKGMDGFVFAVKHAVILGSYFSFADKIWPQLELAKNHPYIRSRRDQEDVAMSFADENFDVAVLELPYIFGTQPGRKPVWVFLVENIRGMKGATMWPKGGSAMVTVKQVGQAIAGALERNRGGFCYPIGYYNYSWKQLLKVCHKTMGVPNKKIITIPDWMYALGGLQIMQDYKKRGIQGGLHMVKFAKIQCNWLYIDKSLGCDFLGVEPDDIDAAIADSVQLCIDILDNKAGNIVAMKGE